MKLETFKRNLKHDTDANHGWVCVSLAELCTLNLANEISSFSYVAELNDGSIYVHLEEDRDLTLYLNALKARGIEYEISQGTHTNGDHWIRSLSQYQQPVRKANQC